MGAHHFCQVGEVVEPAGCAGRLEGCEGTVEDYSLDPWAFVVPLRHIESAVVLLHGEPQAGTGVHLVVVVERQDAAVEHAICPRLSRVVLILSVRVFGQIARVA